MQKPVTGSYALPMLVRILSKISLVSSLKGPRCVLCLDDMDAVNATLGLSVNGEKRIIYFKAVNKTRKRVALLCDFSR